MDVPRTAQLWGGSRSEPDYVRDKDMNDKRYRMYYLKTYGTRAALSAFSEEHWDADALIEVIRQLHDEKYSCWTTPWLQEANQILPIVLILAVLQEGRSDHIRDLQSHMVWDEAFEENPEGIQMLLRTAPLSFIIKVIPFRCWTPAILERAWAYDPVATVQKLPALAITPEMLAWMKARLIQTWDRLCQKDLAIPLQDLLDMIRDRKADFKTRIGKLSRQLIDRCATEEDLRVVFQLLHEWEHVPLTRLPCFMITRTMLQQVLFEIWHRDMLTNCCDDPTPNEKLEEHFDAHNDVAHNAKAGTRLLWRPDDGKNQTRSVKLGPRHHELLLQHFSLHELRHDVRYNPAAAFVLPDKTLAKVLKLG